MILNGKVTELARDSILRVGERGGPEEGHRRKAGALGETVMAIGGGRIYSARFGEGGARRGSRKVGDSGSEGGGARHREGVARRERKGSLEEAEEQWRHLMGAHEGSGNFPCKAAWITGTLGA